MVVIFGIARRPRATEHRQQHWNAFFERSMRQLFIFRFASTTTDITSIIITAFASNNSHQTNYENKSYRCNAPASNIYEFVCRLMKAPVLIVLKSEW
jgi:hypothetical protein